MKKEFTYEHYDTMEEVRKHIQEDEGHCIQQSAYSTFHDGLTQINFTKRIIRSTIKI
ncbi:MAG: hypothetical protein WC758_08090 [Candidatus Woesearchaeota archaeon]|jgi:hypothetical protein